MITVAAVAAIAAIAYFAFFRKAKAGTAAGYVDRLDVSADIKKRIKGFIANAEATQDINAAAAANGLDYERALALSAAYYLVGSDGITEATWQDWKAQIKAM